MENYTPNKENKILENNDIIVYSYCDDSGKAIHKAKEYYKNENKIILYPYSVKKPEGSVRSKKIKVIEFRGWNELRTLPDDFRKIYGYGFQSQRLKMFMTSIYSKFPEIEKLVIDINASNRFSKKTITLNWFDLENILKEIGREKIWYDKNRKVLINNSLASLTDKVKIENKRLFPGELDRFLKKFDTYEKVSPKDIDSLAKIIHDLPSSRISKTSYFIETKERIENIFIEDLIVEYKKALADKKDSEEKWQIFFQKNSWILNHLFPYEVILKKGKAYVGGKTIENEEGRIVDYLFQSGFKDNYALLEIKTPKKELLKKSVYRAPEVFSLSDELSGGINQCLDQKDVFIKDFGNQYQILDPKCILIIGLKENLEPEQNKCFELFRSNMKNVMIVTFDEVLAKLEGLYKVIAKK